MVDDALEAKITTKNLYIHVEASRDFIPTELVNQDDFELFVTLCWAIWMESCKRNHDTEGKISSLCVDWVYAFFDAVRASSLKCAIPVDSTQLTTTTSWIP